MTEPTRCPVCNHPDPYAFMRCNDPRCTDGRHAGGAALAALQPYHPNLTHPCATRPVMSVNWPLLAGLAVSIGAWVLIAFALWPR